jgi:branched-chain amino acid transport system substrate-binding protein
MLDGINLYLDEINHRMAGRSVQLVVENDNSSPEKAMECFKKLVDVEKVQILSGINLSNVGYALVPLIEKSGIPTVISVAQGDDLTQRKHPKSLVRTQASASQTSFPLGDWASKRLHYKRVATLSMKYAYGYEAVGGFQTSFEEAGGQVIQKLWAPLGTTDFTSLIKQMRTDADAVFVAAAGAPADLIPKQMQELGIKLPMLGSGTSFDEAQLRKYDRVMMKGVNSRGYCMTLPWTANRKFVAQYKAKHGGDDPPVVVESGYTSFMWIDKAVKTVNGDVENRDKLDATLKSTEVDAPRGHIKLDDYGNPVENIYIRQVERRDGQIINPIIYTYYKCSQFWKYAPKEYLQRPSFGEDNPPCAHCGS